MAETATVAGVHGPPSGTVSEQLPLGLPEPEGQALAAIEAHWDDDPVQGQPGTHEQLTDGGLNVDQQQELAAMDQQLSGTESLSSTAEASPKPGAVKLGRFATARVVLANRLPGERLAQARLAKAQQAAGSLATASEVTPETVQPATNESLWAMMRPAYEGKEEARKGAETNARTWAIENLYKYAHIFKVEAHIDVNREIVQYGQTASQRDHNTRRYYLDQSPVRLRHTDAEGLNVYRIGANHDGSQTRTYLEMSAVPDTDREQLKGYFLGSMTFILRMTTVRPDGTCTIESALVGGVDPDVLPDINAEDPHSEVQFEEQALESRFDIQVARSMLELLEVPGTKDLQTDELLGTLLDVSGVGLRDFVQLYDTVASQLLGGKPVFFGRTDLGRQRGDQLTEETYLAQERISQKLQQDLEPLITAITDDFVGQHDKVHNELEATHLLSKVGMRHLMKYLVSTDRNEAVEELAFGPHVPGELEAARAANRRGDQATVDRLTNHLVKTARDSSCPPPENGSNASNGEDDEDELVNMTCPQCGDSNQFGYKCSSHQHCTACNARVIDGVLVNPGDGGVAARRKEHAERIAAAAINLDRLLSPGASGSGVFRYLVASQN
jgi:hypothetical protein